MSRNTLSYHRQCQTRRSESPMLTLTVSYELVNSRPPIAFSLPPTVSWNLVDSGVALRYLGRKVGWAVQPSPPTSCSHHQLADERSCTRCDPVIQTDLSYTAPVTSFHCQIHCEEKNIIHQNTYTGTHTKYVRGYHNIYYYNKY